MWEHTLCFLCFSRVGWDTRESGSRIRITSTFILLHYCYSLSLDLSDAPCRPRTRRAWVCGSRWRVLPTAVDVAPGQCLRSKLPSPVYQCRQAEGTASHLEMFPAVDLAAKIAGSTSQIYLTFSHTAINDLEPIWSNKKKLWIKIWSSNTYFNVRYFEPR